MDISTNIPFQNFLSDPRSTEAATICRNTTAPESDRPVHVANYLAALNSVTTQFDAHRYYGLATSGTGNNTVYAFAQCMRDLSEDDCNLCFSEVKVQSTKCRPVQMLTKGGGFFTTAVFSGRVWGCCFGAGSEGEFGWAEERWVLYWACEERGNLTVYGLGQCWEYVNRSGCVECLEKSVSRIGSCAPKVEGRVLNAGCYVRYSTTRFYNNSASDAQSGNGEAATNYFHISNKLGQGGSGSVYKGILPSGQIVAVKRLMFNTTQWADHFFNEVNLISGINHKNLVKLLGCSITGPESLLVYEYVPNLSLHDHLFGRKDVGRLGWLERYKIIMGVAEGLAYLHEESNLRIIHRDIKLSNILLEDDFTAKIADFGLVRLFPQDKSHITTGVAGTLGYMAPEYIVRGKLTEKADVYGFGILVIEVVCGAKVNAFAQDSYSILQMVWNMYGTLKLSEAVDSSIKGKFPNEEANRLLQIGLSCVQADAELRPTMPVVVKMIRGEHEISSPTQPPFLSTSNSNYYQPTGAYYYRPDSCTGSSGNEITESFLGPR
ncbi:cysteine-rich receptor-like protein kinase 3 [Phtheirospermum japonicum]|uniref:Cysteine-rich receptor-like protein kinase 3 n=1 Tax=Phtheirospermum japonicum TaxID=374723 RepID=A0A830DJV2_9LAMI|nr:cysteine-rich receptor-like protein kinase 3 [Phtheirospermum japonicum]